MRKMIQALKQKLIKKQFLIDKRALSEEDQVFLERIIIRKFCGNETLSLDENLEQGHIETQEFPETFRKAYISSIVDELMGQFSAELEKNMDKMDEMLKLMENDEGDLNSTSTSTTSRRMILLAEGWKSVCALSNRVTFQVTPVVVSVKTKIAEGWESFCDISDCVTLGVAPVIIGVGTETAKGIVKSVKRNLSELAGWISDQKKKVWSEIKKKHEPEEPDWHGVVKINEKENFFTAMNNFYNFFHEKLIKKEVKHKSIGKEYQQHDNLNDSFRY